MTETREPGKHWMDTGQDWTSDSFTEDEYKAMADWYATVHGEGNLDLTQFIPFMMDLRPDSLKLYRRWVETVPAGRSVENGVNDPAALVWQHYYGTNAYREGYLYEVIMAREFGATKAEVAQTTVLSWLHGGPLGLNSAAAAAMDYMREWDPAKDDAKGLEYPAGWAPDPGAFRSGIDMDPDTPFTPDDLAKLSDWHVRVQGEVPDYVPVLAEFNGGALKLWRARYENAAVGPLPKQFIALLQVHQAMMMAQPGALRRAAHMAKVFGVTRAQVGQILASVQVYRGDLGMETIAAVRPLLDAWDA